MQSYNVICCFIMVYTHFSPEYKLKFNVLIFLIMAPVKNGSWPPGSQFETIRYPQSTSYRGVLHANKTG